MVTTNSKSQTKKQAEKRQKKIKKILLFSFGLLVGLYLGYMIVAYFYNNNKTYGYVDFDNHYGTSQNCGNLRYQEIFCKVDNAWIPVQTYWQE